MHNKITVLTSQAEFYMTNLENTVLENIDLKSSLYCRYVDDIYVVVRNEDHLLYRFENEYGRTVGTSSYVWT